MPLARISLTLSRHFSLSFIASGRSSGLHPVSHSCCVYVLAGRPAFTRPYVGVHRSTSLMISFLLLQQCRASLVRLRVLVLCEMQSISFRIWTRVAVSISYDDNHYFFTVSNMLTSVGNISLERDLRIS